MREEILRMGKDARSAAHQMAKVGSSHKREALEHLAGALEKARELIELANQKDIQGALKKGLPEAKVDRLRLSDKVLGEMIEGLQEIALLPDPIGEITRMWIRPNGLRVGRMRIPLGVVGIVYESRPNVTIDAAALCIKAGNAVVLRGGSEAFCSNQCLAEILRESLKASGLPSMAVQLVGTTERSAVLDMLKLEEYIDVMIPRGGEDLIRFVTEHARMPVLKHYKGVCHVYVDAEADLDHGRTNLFECESPAARSMQCDGDLACAPGHRRNLSAGNGSCVSQRRGGTARLWDDSGHCARLPCRYRGRLVCRIP